MASTEQALLSHYNLKSLYPTEWPADKDSDNEEPVEETSRPKPSRRYTRLERGPGSRFSTAPRGPPKEGHANSVQQDEPDPLGVSRSVLSVLKRRGLPVDADPSLKNRFLLSSTAFSPSQYLSEVHRDASTETLLQGLDFLSNSIEKKSASLKVLVESNFERFVRAKATIDHVYEEMRNHGSEGLAVRGPHSRQHSRHVSRGSQSFRSYGGGPASPTASRYGAPDKSKNALAKETEYGTVGIRNPLNEATVKAEEVWGPALGGRLREENLKSLVASLERNTGVFEAALAVEDCSRRRDYEGLVESYARMRQYAAEAKGIAAKAKENESKLSDAQLHQIVLTARVWQDVETRIDDFRKETLHRLTETQFIKFSQGATEAKSDEYMDLISVLLQLGVQENPLTAYLFSHCEYLKSKATGLFERARIELEISRRKLSTGKKPTSKQLGKFLKAAAEPEHKESLSETDSFAVIQFWEKEVAAVDSLLNTKNGILSEVADYWETAQGFIDGKRQRSLPVGIDGQSRHHHHLSQEVVAEIRARAKDLVKTIRDQVYALFMEKPVDDISSLYTPLPTTPRTPTSAAGLTPTAARHFQFHPSDIPPPSPSIGEAWESFAFWPPYSNSLSAALFLSKLVNMIGMATAEIASIDLIRQDEGLIYHLRVLVNDVRDRSITAICSAWQSDCDQSKELEDWARSPEKPDITRLPAHFGAWGLSMLSSLQKIVYISDAGSASGSSEVILPPPSKHIDSVQTALKTSFFKSFSAMMRHATKLAAAEGGSEVDPAVHADGTDWATDSGAALTLNMQILLTMSNYDHIRAVTLETLTSQFEANFSKTISSDKELVKNIETQVSGQIFDIYLKPILNELRVMITAGIAAKDYSTPGRQPTDASPYVYSVLMRLTLVHSEVSLTAPSQTHKVLSRLLEQVSAHLIAAFQAARERYTLESLMQATLDVEFISQTLGAFNSPAAGDTQGRLYLALDERTDNEARQRLQSELPEMRGILKRLREKTKGEFGAFRAKKSRKGRDGSGNAPGHGGGQGSGGRGASSVR